MTGKQKTFNDLFSLLLQKHPTFLFALHSQKKSEAPFHFAYHKCADCGSFNTTLVSVFVPPQKE